MHHRSILLAALVALAAPAAAQDEGLAEIVVTGSRSDGAYYSEAAPLIGLRRVADFAVREVRITSDTRETQKRRDEIFAMLRSAVDLAARHGVELAIGDFVVEPVTVANFRDLPVLNDSRPDTSQVSFLVKTPIGRTDGKAALDRIGAFIDAVPANGRAEMLPSGDLTLSVVGPEQYRTQILALVAADAGATSASFGPDYRIDIRGIDRAVEWSRASLSEVFLYLPYSYTVGAAR